MSTLHLHELLPGIRFVARMWKLAWQLWYRVFAPNPYFAPIPSLPLLRKVIS